MQVCTMVFAQTALTASGRPLSPSQTTMHTSRDAAVLDLRQHPQPVLGALAVAVLAGPQPRMSRSPSTVTPSAR
jgi:hypothetical protein